MFQVFFSEQIPGPSCLAQLCVSHAAAPAASCCWRFN